jgi:hypothetical protein
LIRLCACFAGIGPLAFLYGFRGTDPSIIVFSITRRVDVKRWLAGFSLSVPAFGQEHGDFSVLEMDRTVVEDVFVQGNDIYLKIDNAYWDETFTVKISNKNMADYRTWLSEEEERTIKVYRSPRENRQGYTYRVNTAARYVEYWMDGRLVLHLERAS